MNAKNKMKTMPSALDEEPFQIHAYGSNLPNQPYHEEIGQSPATRIECVLSGQGVLYSWDYSSVINAGDTYILHQDDNYSYYSDPRDLLNKVWIEISGSLVQNLFRLYQLEDSFLFRNVDISLYLYRIHNICQNAKETWEIQEQASGVFSELVHFLSKQQIQSLSNRDLSDRIRNYIDLHVGDNITIEELSGIFHATYTHIIRAFKQKFGITPHQYMLDQKAKAARIMLGAENFSVEETAERLGFGSAGHFSDVFYRHNGIRPSEYRRMHRGLLQQVVNQT